MDFPYYLWNMIQYKNGISWSNDGKTILIHVNILEKFQSFRDPFKMIKFPNFRRLLNMYGFKGVKALKGRDGIKIFKHKFFQKDKPELLKYIRKRKMGRILKYPRCYFINSEDEVCMFKVLRADKKRRLVESVVTDAVMMDMEYVPNQGWIAFGSRIINDPKQIK